MYVYIYMYVTTAYCHQKEKITTKEENVRYWLGEHLLEVYSVHQHGEGELIEKETIEMKKKKKRRSPVHYDDRTPVHSERLR